MKKLLLVLLAVGLFASCQKKPTTPPVKKQAVSFGVNVVSPSNLKADPVQCQDGVIPDMAWIQIDGVDYYAQLTTVNGMLYTQSIQLSPDSANEVTEFVLYKEVDGTKGLGATDEIVYGTPITGSPYAIYVDKPLSFNIEVSAFSKNEVPVEVLCFTPNEYNSFGYDWFVIDRVVVREQCFFGDFCTKHYMEYGGETPSDYAKQSTGLQLDMPAIFKVMAYVQNGNSWDLIPGGNAADGGFTNDTEAMNYGVGAPLCIKYGDKLGVVDNYKFDLYILVKTGDTFSFVLFHTWTFTDAEMIDNGGDGVVDFELGNCNVGGADLQLGPYLNLPTDPITLKTINNIPSHNVFYHDVVNNVDVFAYFDISLSNFPAGSFDIAETQYPVFCLSRHVDITVPHTYTNMMAESSLYPELMLSTAAQNIPWDQINWLLNHLDSYPGFTWSDLQQALWVLEEANNTPPYAGDFTNNGQIPVIGSIGTTMVANAQLLGNGFVPGPGDFAAVAFEPTDNADQQDPTLQIVMIRIDP